LVPISFVLFILNIFEMPSKSKKEKHAPRNTPQEDDSEQGNLEEDLRAYLKKSNGAVKATMDEVYCTCFMMY
jgi:hypothetical protein